MDNLPQFSLFLPTFSKEDPGGWSHIFNQARAADAVGVDRLMVPDHVVFGEDLDAYSKPEAGGKGGGKQPTGPDGHFLEPLTALSMIAGMTSTIRLRTHILLAALRRPIVLAKVASTLDVLSNGRFDLGVGVGWQREEFEAANIPFLKRGRMLDHSLEVCTTLWHERSASYQAPELSFANLHQMPKPTRPEGVPIWIGGTVRESVARRIARFGMGWIPWGEDASNILESIPRMRDAISAAGGDADRIQIVGHLPSVRLADGAIDFDRTMEKVPPLVDAGVTDFFSVLPTPDDQAAAEDYLHEVIVQFRAAVGRRG